MQKRQTLTKLLPAALICAAVLSPAGAAEAKNEITVAVASTFTTMDPWNATDTLSQAVAKSFYEGLFKFDREMNVIPSLAESAESSPDGMQHVVHLRRGVKFHDGTTFTAEAVKANFDRITTPGSTLKRFFLFENVASLKVLDPYTVRFPPRGSNESYYSNPAVDQALFYALGTTDREKKSAIYAQMQETIWKDAPWIFLVSEQNIAASSKALHGFYIQPDSSFNFEEASLEPASLMKP